MRPLFFQRTKRFVDFVFYGVQVKGEEEIDEFSAIFGNKAKPKLCITTCYKASKVSIPTVSRSQRMYDFIRDLLWMIPNSFYYERRGVQVTVMSDKSID